jgi:ASC-1-like (ASCH) protein
MKEGRKIIEVRLNDEKRQKIKIGDVIVFSKLPELTEKVKVEILELRHYKIFKDLYLSYPFASFGCEGKTMDWMLERTYDIYTKEQEIQFGALAIRIRVIQ